MFLDVGIGVRFSTPDEATGPSTATYTLTCGCYTAEVEVSDMEFDSGTAAKARTQDPVWPIGSCQSHKFINAEHVC